MLLVSLRNGLFGGKRLLRLISYCDDGPPVAHREVTAYSSGEEIVPLGSKSEKIPFCQILENSAYAGSHLMLLETSMTKQIVIGACPFSLLYTVSALLH